MTSTMTMTGTSTFDRDGVTFPIPVLDDAQLAHARAQLGRIEAAQGAVLKRFDRAHLYFRWAYDLATHPRVLGPVSEVLGDDIVVWGCLILSKPPHDPGFVAWHQDGHYAGFLGDAPSISAWIALSDSTIESGCMRVVPGSHKQKLAHEVTNLPENLLNQGHEIAAKVEESEAVDVQLHAGEMSLHHVDIVHGSNANRSDRARTGFIVRYTTPAMIRSVTPVLVAKGRDVTHLDVHRQVPGDDFEESMQKYRASR
jgi:non-heme Fe2+,alpha-ketoglutarate-dependent halogenase